MSFGLFFADFSLGLLAAFGAGLFIWWLDRGYAKELIRCYTDAVHEICELQRENKRLKAEKDYGSDSIHSDDHFYLDPDWWKG